MDVSRPLVLRVRHSLIPRVVSVASVHAGCGCSSRASPARGADITPGLVVSAKTQGSSRFRARGNGPRSVLLPKQHQYPVGHAVGEGNKQRRAQGLGLKLQHKRLQIVSRINNRGDAILSLRRNRPRLVYSVSRPFPAIEKARADQTPPTVDLVSTAGVRQWRLP